MSARSGSITSRRKMGNKPGKHSLAYLKHMKEGRITASEVFQWAKTEAGINLALREIFEDFKGTEELTVNVDRIWLAAIEDVGWAVQDDMPGPGGGHLQYDETQALNRAIELADNERKRKPTAFIGAVPRVAETTIAINAHAEATCFRCGALIELNLGKWSIDDEPTPDSEPIRVEFVFPTVCPSCGRVFYDAKFGDEDDSP